MNELYELYEIVKERKEKSIEGSYTTYLFEKGEEKILKKFGEESTELIISALRDDKCSQISESCDLLYHLIVLLVQLNISLEEIEVELVKRTQKTLNFKGERKIIENL